MFEEDLLHGARISKGQFTEDNLGQHMLQLALSRPECELGEEASKGVLNVCSQYGGWLWSDGGGSPIYHLDGRKFLSHAERATRGIGGTPDLRYRLAAAVCNDDKAAQRARQFLRFLTGVANA